MKNKAVVLLLVLIGAVTIYLKNSKEIISVDSKSEIVPGAKTKGKKGFFSKGKDPESDIVKEKILKAQKKTSLKFRLPVNKSNLIKDGKLKVSLNISRENCRLGDVDLIEKISNGDERKTILISLESLDSSNKYKSIKKLTYKELLTSPELEFNYEVKKKVIPFGLFLCFDEIGDENCKNNVVKDFNEIINSGKVDNRNLLFYFQFILGESSELMAHDNPLNNDSNYKSYRDYLSFSGYSEKTISEVFNNVSIYNSKIRSYPVSFSNKTVKIKLPKQKDKVACSSLGIPR